MKKLVLVETISMFRHRYAIEANNIVDALDEVTLGLPEEMSQKHLQEVIVSEREITEEEYFCLFDEDEYIPKNWTDEEKKHFIHKIDYEQE